jgi:hydroxyacylglutathione hydrolase
MKRFILMMMFVIALPLTVSACGVGEMTADGYENVPVSHVHEHVLMGKASPIPFIVIDVRTPEEYAEGHIQGAKPIPLQILPDHLADVPKDKQVYVYCHSGRRSAKAAKLLASHGFTRVENMQGGIEAWKNAGYKVVK